MNSAASPEQINRSTFVSVLAWVFIIIAGFGTLIAILQNIMINMMLPAEHMQAIPVDADQKVPGVVVFMMKNIQWFFAGFLVVTAATFVSAIGLLRRKNWARIGFIAIMAFGILWNIGGVIFQQIFISSMPMPAIPSGAPSDFKSQVDTMADVMIIFSALIALGFSALFGWIIKRLVSSPIKAEFA